MASEVLQYLLNAPSKQFVDQLFLRTFSYRLDLENQLKKASSDPLVETISSGLSITVPQTAELLQVVLQIISECLIQKASEAEQIRAILTEKFSLSHSNLLTLLSAIVCAHYSEWRQACINSQISMPRLVDFDWRVDIRTASQLISRMAAPTVIVQMSVQPPAERVGEMPQMQKVAFELNKDNLQVMLDGLGKIRDQLERVSGR